MAVGCRSGLESQSIQKKPLKDSIWVLENSAFFIHSIESTRLGRLDSVDSTRLVSGLFCSRLKIPLLWLVLCVRYGGALYRNSQYCPECGARLQTTVREILRCGSTHTVVAANHPRMDEIIVVEESKQWLSYR